MQKKGEDLSHFQKLKAQVEKETGRHIQCLQLDGGKEYLFDDSSPTSKVKAYGENSRADTHPNKMEYPKGRNSIYSR